MIAYLAELGAWNWIVLGVVLLTLEIVVPGVFLLWIGAAALVTGTLSLQLADTGFWGWQVQVLVFLALSVVAVIVGRRYFSERQSESDQPLLNRREAQLVGRTAMLEEDIVEGRGRIRLGDTLWIVTGPDLAAGTRVRVSSAANGELTVEPV